MLIGGLLALVVVCVIAVLRVVLSEKNRVEP